LGLYLCIFASEDFDDELDGIDIGSYEDFHEFRQAVCDNVEDGKWGSTCPVLMTHSDCDGMWGHDVGEDLTEELARIQDRFRQLPPRVAEGWQYEAFRMYGQPASLADYFIDVDGEPLIERMSALAVLASQRGRPISFQ
jgi:hypothetical protein